jgi:hypothetical protein
VGRALQITSENTVSRAATGEMTGVINIGNKRGACTALDRHVNRTLTIDELHDLHDQLCPDLADLAEPQQSANS